MKSERQTMIACAIAALLIASCSDTETHTEGQDGGHVTHWGYAADDGPTDWGSMNSEWLLCAEGREQSPIDLTDATELELGKVAIDTPSGKEVEVLNQKGVIGALDNGHTIQINAKTGETMTIGDKTYALVQFHFHAPSEHTVYGEHYPMEMHLVHQAEDGALAVAGVFIQEGAENPGIVPLWAQLPEMPGTVVTVRVPTEFADSIFSGYSTGVYHYSGSLTTPPCSEGVNWYIRKTPTQFSRDQIAAFMAIYDHNNRPVQALNERTLYLDETPVVTIY